jgi:diguanylate cyclase (GGDEF)-like protein
MLDIDRFKLYNDAFGHRAGDECLAQVAKILDQSVPRAGDLLARYGGEEFAAILSGTDESGGAGVAERLRAAVERLGIKLSDDPTQVVTISVGVAAGIPGQVWSHEVLLGAADKALYEAKRAGRNRVCTASRHLFSDRIDPPA